MFVPSVPNLPGGSVSGLVGIEAENHFGVFSSIAINK